MTTNHGSIEFIKFPNPLYPGDSTRMIKKWLRDSWARRKIAAMQSSVFQMQGRFTGSIDSTTITPGIYNAETITITVSGSQAVIYGTFIQFPGTYKAQLIIGGPAGACNIYTRRYLTGSSSWTAWTSS